MPTKTQWRMFHYINRDGSLVKEWDGFSKMTFSEAGKFLSKYIVRRIKPSQNRKRRY
jgi:hypothetical protein